MATLFTHTIFNMKAVSDLWPWTNRSFEGTDRNVESTCGEMQLGEKQEIRDGEIISQSDKITFTGAFFFNKSVSTTSWPACTGTGIIKISYQLMLVMKVLN